MIAVAWFGLPAIIFVYSYLRWYVDGDLAFAVAQLVFLVAPVLAATFAGGAAWAAPAGSRPRTIWGLVTASASLLLIGEVYTSWMQLSAGLPQGFNVVADVANALGLLCTVALLAVIARIERMGFAGAMRLVLDLTVVVTLGFILVLDAWMSGPLAGVETEVGVQMALYALGGIALLALDLFVVFRLEPVRRGPWVLLLNVSIGLFALAMMLWPLWQLAATGVQPAPAAEMLTSNLFLAGYYLTFVSALLKLTSSDATLPAVGAEVRTISSLWPGVAVSVLVLMAVVALGVSAFRVPADSPIRVLHLGALIVATACLVGRTALVDIERQALRAQTVTDVVTGASNPRGFEGRLNEHLVSMRRFGEPFGLILIDLDDFAEVSTSLSLEEGDRILAEVAGALRELVNGRGATFRLSGDGFAVLISTSSRRDVHEVAEAARDLIGGMKAGERSLAASVGFALCPDDALSREHLVRRSEAALAWAKRHGKNRVAGYDSRVGRALRAEELRLPLDETKLGVARALSAAADARDPENYVHSRNVAALARMMAEDLGFEPQTLERVHLAALLHDVGKIAQPSLRGRAARTPEAAAAHAELGERILLPLEIEGVASWVRSHHERWDGAGLPDGLAGEAIPLESRIIALADAYDRATSVARPGGALSRAAALQEIDLGLGSRFDPDLTERFILLVATMDAVGLIDEWPAA